MIAPRATMSGESRISAAAAAQRSNRPLSSRRRPDQLRVIDVQQGQPGRRPDRRPRPATSSRAGETHRSVPVFSSSQARLPELNAVHFRAGEHRDRIRAAHVHGGRDVIEPSVHWDLGDLVALRRLGHAGADHRQPVVLIAPELLDQVGYRRFVAYGYHAEHAAGPMALPVQSLADGVPGEQIEHRGGGQGDEHVAAGQLEVDRVGEERDRRGEAHPGVQYLAELVRTGPDEADVITPGQPDSPIHSTGKARLRAI